MLRTFFTDIFRAWGFDSASDYARTVLGVKAMSSVITPIALKTLFVLLGLGLSFWGKYVWYPPEASLLILGMNLVNAWYGYQVAKQVKKERFSRIKFQKTFSIMVSDILAMAMMHIAIKHYPLFESGKHVLFSYLFGFKFTGIFSHWVALKLQSGSFVAYFRAWLIRVLSSNMGSQVVDSIQGRTPDAVPAITPPPTPDADESAA